MLHSEGLPEGVPDPVALVLGPAAMAALPVAASGVDHRSRSRHRVLAVLTARFAPSARLVADTDGRRRLSGSPLYASVAERDGWAAAAVASVPVGIDIESVAEAEAAAAVVLAGVTADAAARQHGLAGVWAAREAVLKACGRGLADDPGAWEMVEGHAAARGIARHRVNLLALPGYVAAVAYVGS